MLKDTPPTVPGLNLTTHVDRLTKGATMPIDRRQFVVSSLAGAASLLASHRLAAADQQEPAAGLHAVSSTPLRIKSVELLRGGGAWFVRSITDDGAEGVAVCNERVEYLYPILLQRVAPFFVGKDARDLEQLVDGVYVHQSNYKLAGLPLWCCVGWVEFSLMDLLGKVAGKPVAELLGGIRKREIDVYLSSLRRDTTPEQEVEWVGQRLAETGARAVKLKIGGRMSNNRDASPGRTDRLVPLARKTFGEAMTIYVDANGSYDADKAIEVGRMLEAHNVGFYEEPCPFEDLEATRRVTAALDVPVAGGEQDASLPRFAMMIQQRVVDIVQPDLNYNGGFLRCRRVAWMAAAAGMPITPHSPQPDANVAYMLQFAAATANAGPFMEFAAQPRRRPAWLGNDFEPRDGKISLPDGPGLGLEIDPVVLQSAKVVRSGLP
jgi:L-alanine-DL-glutamate epimerase-like enolase superfamily enzyme